MILLTSIANYFAEFEIYLGGFYGSKNRKIIKFISELFMQGAEG